MNNQDFLWPFPPWRLSTAFLLVTLFSMISGGSSAFILVKLLNGDSFSRLAIVLIYALLFCAINITLILGKNKFVTALLLYQFTSIAIQAIGIITMGVASINIFIVAIGVLSIFIINSSYYKGFIFYRKKHMNIIKTLKYNHTRE